MDGVWLPDTLPTYPDSRAVVDSAGDRLLLFDPSGPATRVWGLALDGSSPATLLAPLGAPPPSLHDATLVYDPDSARVLMFGGWRQFSRFRIAVDSLFELRLGPPSSWQRPTPVHSGPAARFGHVAVIDRVRRRMLVQGGVLTSTLGSPEYFNDVWALELGDTLRWDSLATAGTGPGPVVATTAFAAIDGVRDRLILGDSGNDTTWTLALAGVPAWSFTLQGGARPLTRVRSVVAADPGSRRLFLLGLRDSTGRPVESAFALDYASLQWSAFPAMPDTTVTTGTPTAATDPARGVLWVAGLAERGDGVWTIPATGAAAWSRVFGRGVDPQGAELGALWVDATADRAYFMGGVVNGISSDWSSLWSFPLDGDTASRFYWTESILGAGLSPARADVAWAFDSRRRALLLFGGSPPEGGTLADLRRFDATTLAWQALATSAVTPSPRAGARAVYDPATDRMYMFGGENGSIVAPELWSLALGSTPSQWSLIPASRVPYAAGGQSGEAFALDSRRDRLCVFGGSNPVTADVWTIDPRANPPTWTRLETAGSPPQGRGYATLVYDAVGDRLLVHGGIAPPGFPLGDLWALSLSGTPTWTQLQPDFPPPARAFHAAAYDLVHDRMLSYGGSFQSDRDLRVLQWERDHALPPPLPPPATGLALAVLSNPSPAGVRIAVGLPSDGDVRVDLVDLTGRQTFTTVFPAMSAGPHVLAVAPGTRAGLYWVRVRQGRFRASARVAILR